MYKFQSPLWKAVMIYGLTKLVKKKKRKRRCQFKDVCFKFIIIRVDRSLVGKIQTWRRNLHLTWHHNFNFSWFSSVFGMWKINCQGFFFFFYSTMKIDCSALIWPWRVFPCDSSCLLLFFFSKKLRLVRMFQVRSIFRKTTCFIKTGGKPRCYVDSVFVIYWIHLYTVISIFFLGC